MLSTTGSPPAHRHDKSVLGQQLDAIRVVIVGFDRR
jgi:hypothetical protein